MTDLTINIMGVKMTPRPPEYTRKWTPMAFIDITIPELQLEVNGALLAHQKGKFLAHPPKPTARGSGVQWAINSRFASFVAEKAVKQYEAMGGKMPTEPKPKRQFIPMADLVLSEDEGIPLLRRIEDALDDETEKRGVPCFTETFGLTTADVKAAADYAADGQDDDDNVEGLHRVLGIDPVVAAECDRAGL